MPRARPATAGHATTPVRLNRYLSIAGITSRRKADEYILAGRVSVNGRVVTDLGTKIRPGTDSVFFNGKQVVDIDPKVYIILNKPKDCITTLSDEKGRRSVLDVVKFSKRIFPVGRLDRNTTGALILTNDGDFANLLMHPRNKVPKSYLVTTDGPVSPAALRELADGVPLEDGRTAPAGVELIPGAKNCVVGITIREGRNRQVHRMFQATGYMIEKLDRVAYGPISYEGLARGEWRYLTPAEVRALTSMAGEGNVAPRVGKEKPVPNRTRRAPRDPRGGPAKGRKRPGGRRGAQPGTGGKTSVRKRSPGRRRI
jgi:23S rRNA pseudouridine2605 synthase